MTIRWHQPDRSMYQFRLYRDRQVRDHVFIIGNQVNPNRFRCNRWISGKLNRHRILIIGQIGLKDAIKLTRNKIPIWGFSMASLQPSPRSEWVYPSVCSLYQLS